MPQVTTPLTLPSGLTLAELNAKYPSCSTCRFRCMRQTGRGKKVGHVVCCEQHNRPVEYEYHEYVDEKGKRQRMILRDIPCRGCTYRRSHIFAMWSVT